MRRLLLPVLMFALPWVSLAGDFKESLVIETGVLRESDLIVRNITDLNSRKTCMAFYIRTAGTRPMLTCYDVQGAFGTKINQVGHLKEGNLVVRKVQDFTNSVACLVAYVGTQGTSPNIACFAGKSSLSSSLVQDGHLREGDLDVTRIIDPDGAKTCLVAYVDTPRTVPSLLCYETRAGHAGVLQQLSVLREGDLVVRKIIDGAGGKACLVTYVSTEGTSTNLFCYDDTEDRGTYAPPRTAAPAPAPVPPPRTAAPAPASVPPLRDR
jgi:hypothetical protein